jgi:hypothetical protein
MPSIPTIWKRALALAALLAYGMALNVGVLQPDAPQHPDSPPFVEVVELLNGDYHGNVAPFRIGYPVYPYLAWMVGKVVSDAPLAARVAGAMATVASPFLILLACRMLGCAWWSSWMAALLLASSPALVKITRLPLYDSTFILATALVLVAALAAVRSRTVWSFTLAGCAVGLAAATRGPGIFYLAALILPVLTMRGMGWQRKTLLCGGALIAGGASFAALLAPTYLLSASLPTDPRYCTKRVIHDGILYSEGVRDDQVYSLPADCRVTGDPTNDTCLLSWSQFVRQYGVRWGKMAVKNVKNTILRDGVTFLTPFMALFVPLGLGLFFVLKKGLPSRESAFVLALVGLPYLTIVPALQFQDRYLFPLLVVICALAGCGFHYAAQMLERRWNVVLAGTCLGLAAIAGFDQARQNIEPDYVWANYREASVWIRKTPEYQTSNVLARTLGVYAFLGKLVVEMPKDSLERVLCFGNANKARFILQGPNERSHNPLVVAAAGPGQPELVATFGEGSDTVNVLRVRE